MTVERHLQPVGSAPEGDWSTAWVDALTELELQVEQAEAMLRSESADLPAPLAWSPPELPPIPPDLIERARLVHARQLDVAARMTRRMGDLGKQSTLASRIETGTAGRARPVLLDRAC
ncbi:hypothetical protein [Motilibacter aurantiacus]|uniref:hypothetical protein n=1 Tax=Motilibacter aurantiacus TaxID=2714955 RepID=UPI00140CDBF4|nr:hypothetical protein [Motilibacter aurantiacus]NHC47089.1 hypothetical protein [Motilibacter aurantiacus]